jgi:hypothetical protein
MIDSEPRQTLATGQHCQIERCACGVVHLTVGPITVRVPPTLLGDLFATLYALPADAFGERSVRGGDA